MRAKTRCQKNWDYQKLSLMNESAYALGLVLAFVLLTAPFFPVTGTALFAITVTGGVLCLAFSIIYGAINSNIEIMKSHDSAKEAREDYLLKIDEFLTLQKRSCKA